MTDKPEYQPQAGHNVRRTMVTEGVVQEVSKSDQLVKINDLWCELSTEHSVTTWERIPDPEPDWQPGDVARRENGRLIHRFRFQLGDTWFDEKALPISDPGPLTPVILRGKVVEKEKKP